MAGLKAPKRAMRTEREGMYLQGTKGAVSIQEDLRLPIYGVFLWNSKVFLPLHSQTTIIIWKRKKS